MSGHPNPGGARRAGDDRLKKMEYMAMVCFSGEQISEWGKEVNTRIYSSLSGLIFYVYT